MLKTVCFPESKPGQITIRIWKWKPTYVALSNFHCQDVRCTIDLPIEGLSGKKVIVHIACLRLYICRRFHTKMVFLIYLELTVHYFFHGNLVCLQLTIALSTDLWATWCGRDYHILCKLVKTYCKVFLCKLTVLMSHQGCTSKTSCHVDTADKSLIWST